MSVHLELEIFSLFLSKSNQQRTRHFQFREEQRNLCFQQTSLQKMGTEKKCKKICYLHARYGRRPEKRMLSLQSFQIRYFQILLDLSLPFNLYTRHRTYLSLSHPTMTSARTVLHEQTTRLTYSRLF